MKLWKSSKAPNQPGGWVVRAWSQGQGRSLSPLRDVLLFPKCVGLRMTQHRTSPESNSLFPEETAPDNTSQKGSNFLLIIRSFTSASLLPISSEISHWWWLEFFFTANLYSFCIYLSPLPYPIPPRLMFTLFYFGSAIISPHSITFNRLKQWSFFCHPFIRQALHSLRCSCSPLCTCSSLSFTFLSLRDCDGTEQSRGGFASPHASEDHIFTSLIVTSHSWLSYPVLI